MKMFATTGNNDGREPTTAPDVCDRILHKTNEFVFFY